MHSPVTVDRDHYGLMRDDKPFFWLADTCWSAFTNISDSEWEQYLTLRAAQGFNVIQINVLDQWDRCGSALGRYPFATKDGLLYDFSMVNTEYFDHARAMCRAAVEKGFTLGLVVMWCNYVPGTWASQIFPENIMPESCVENVVRTICNAFNEFSPVYIVSGDTDFRTEDACTRYRMVTELVERYAPGLPKAYHICGKDNELPEEFCRHADFYLYQSGHNPDWQDNAFLVAEKFAAQVPQRPVINAEPCYEQMGYSRQRYGRFRRAETRRALWQSLLSGAGAGITYGAHGVWNWQKNGMPARTLIREPDGQKVGFGEGFLRAMPWDVALHFPGAEDYAFAGRFFAEQPGSVPVPCQEILPSSAPQIRAARWGKQILIYLPVNAVLMLRGDWSGYDAEALDLSGGARCAVLPVHSDGKNTWIEMHPFYEDALVRLTPCGNAGKPPFM